MMELRRALVISETERGIQIECLVRYRPEARSADVTEAMRVWFPKRFVERDRVRGRIRIPRWLAEAKEKEIAKAEGWRLVGIEEN